LVDPVGAGGVSDDPESVGERDDGAGAVFVLVIEKRKVQVDAGGGGVLAFSGGKGTHEGEKG